MALLKIAAVSLHGLLLGSLASAQIGPNPIQLRDGRNSFKAPFGLITDNVAGRTLGQYPGFSFVQSFYEGSVVEASIDFSRHGEITTGTYELFVTAHRTPAQWGKNRVLTDARGAPQLVNWTGSTLASNAVTIDTGLLSGDAGLGLGVGYDVVVDVDGDGRLSPGDLIDGFALEAGFYVVRNPGSKGPLVPVEVNDFVTGVKSGFEGENIFYPQNIASMGELPLIIISHGNGHNYNWYDHLGKHFASWGFVVMSHRNDTVPGIETASDTTLTHTDAFLGSLDTLASGNLLGHVDSHQIVWIGHSRGGEGIIRAYDKLFDESYVPTNYQISDILGLSSIAPTVFLDDDDTDPHSVPFHLWTGASDADVNGCGSSQIIQTFLTHERSELDRFSTYLHGAGHGAFHNGGGSLVASGPCLLDRDMTHAIMKTMLLPLVHHYLYAAPAAKEFLWRQDEEFKSPAANLSPCIVISKTFQLRSATRFVVDDFETQTELQVSSSGARVVFDVFTPVENRMDDPSSNFSYSEAQAMNGMTYAVTGESSRGLVFGWGIDGQSIEWEIVNGKRNFGNWRYLSFRASQITRDIRTIAELGDLTFDVQLRDEHGIVSTINIAAYGGGVEEPYQRTGCGSGTGWSNFFETIRLRISDFETDGSLIDLSRIEAIRLVFGSSSGSTFGRMAVDELELTND